MDGHAAGEKSVGLIGLEIINLNPFPDPLQGDDPLFGQPFPVKGQNGVARREGFDRLKSPPAYIERMLRGYPQGDPVGFQSGNTRPLRGE